MPECAVPDAIIASTPLERQRRDRLHRVASSTPAVPPAMISRRAAERAGEVAGQRVGVHVQQRAVRRSTPMLATTGT